MKQREKILAGGLAAVIGVWQAGAQYKNFVVTPIEDRRADIANLEKRISDKEVDLAIARSEQKKYKNWKLRSLSANPIDAANSYQKWLVDLGRKVNLSNVKVIPHTAAVNVKDKPFVAVTAQVTAEGKLSQVRDFLYEFRESKLLHRVNRIKLTTKQPTGDPTISIDLTVEGLALKESLVRDKIGDPETLKEVTLETSKDKSEYDLITKNSLFVRKYNGPPKDTTPGPVIPAEDPRQFVRLTSTFSNGGDFDATLFDPTTNKFAKLSAGGEFNLAGVQGKVVSVEFDSVVLEIAGEKFRLALGAVLTDLQKLSSGG